PIEHPLGLFLLARDEANDVLGQAFRSLVGLDVGDEPVLILIDVDAANPLDRLLDGRHSLLRSRGQGPWLGFVGMILGRFPVAVLRKSRPQPRFPSGCPLYIGCSRASPKPLESYQHHYRWLHIRDLRGLRLAPG